MPIQYIGTAGKYGLNKDLSKHELPPEVWSDALNVRFLDGLAHQAFGYGEYLSDAAVVPYHLLPIQVGSNKYWLYASDKKIYAVTVSGGVITHTNLTRQSVGVDVDYSAEYNSWTSDSLSGIPILNSGTFQDYPQQWGLDVAQNFANLSNWPANVYCKSLRRFKQFLVALNIKDGSDLFPFMVWWSHPADPGSVPISWDYSDTTVDAGRFDLGEGYGSIVDGLQLRDVFMVYRENTIHRGDFVGGTSIFRWSKALGDSGVWNRNCIAEIAGKHAILTNSDIIVHDGNTPESVLDKNLRRWLFQNIDVANFGTSFVFKNPFFNEVYICFPAIGSTVPNMAVVWNYQDNTTSIKEMPSVLHANVGPIDPSWIGTWGSDPDPWGVDETSWDGPDIVPASQRVQMGSGDGNIYMLDGAYSYNGALPNVLLERRGLSFGTTDQIKFVKAIRPIIRGQLGSIVKVSVGGHDDIEGEPIWTTKQFIIGTTTACFFLVSGRYIAVKYETENAYKFRLDSYTVEYDLVGSWP